MKTKLLSARFILAVVIGLTFCAGFLLGMLDSATFAAVAVSVIRDYFTRADRTNPGENGHATNPPK